MTITLSLLVLQGCKYGSLYGHFDKLPNTAFTSHSYHVMRNPHEARGLDSHGWCSKSLTLANKDYIQIDLGRVCAFVIEYRKIPNISLPECKLPTH